MNDVKAAVAYMKFGSTPDLYEAVVSGHTLFSLAISVTVAVILSPLTHRFSGWAETQVDNIQTAAVADPAAR